MTFWEAFFRVVKVRPGQALGALYWHLTRRKVRARNQIRRGAALLPDAHYFWIRTTEEQPDLPRRLADLAGRQTAVPRFDVLIKGGSAAASAQTVRSLKKQAYPEWRLAPAGPNSESDFDTLRSALTSSKSDYLILLAAGDVMPPAALLYLAETVVDRPNAAIIYGDEDQLVHGRRLNPWFKPDWNAELLLGLDYLSGACALNVQAARSLLENPSIASSSDLLLALAAQTGPVVHVPRILVHRGPNRSNSDEEHLKAVKRHVETQGAAARSGPFGTVKVEWPLPAELPLVSIIVPTRDRLELLRPCIDSLLAMTSYSNYEVLVVDNGSVEPATHDYFRQIANDPRVEVVAYDHPYNYSAINNFAVARARGTFLCLLNNDTEVVQGDWLTELMRFAVRKEVGAAGAKLLYGNGLIQHAGVVIGMGDAAGHAHRFTASDQPGYFRLPHVAHYVSAVTAACLVVAKEKFEAVGGLDEEHLAIAYNDVDLCLKLQAAGYRNVYVPHAVLLHHESMSRGDDKSRQHIERYNRELAILQERWSTKSYQDPLLNPNLDRYSETFIAGIRS